MQMPTEQRSSVHALLSGVQLNALPSFVQFEIEAAGSQASHSLEEFSVPVA